MKNLFALSLGRVSTNKLLHRDNYACILHTEHAFMHAPLTLSTNQPFSNSRTHHNTTKLPCIRMCVGKIRLAGLRARASRVYAWSSPDYMPGMLLISSIHAEIGLVLDKSIKFMVLGLLLASLCR